MGLVRLPLLTRYFERELVVVVVVVGLSHLKPNFYHGPVLVCAVVFFVARRGPCAGLWQVLYPLLLIHVRTELDVHIRLH